MYLIHVCSISFETLSPTPEQKEEGPMTGPYPPLKHGPVCNIKKLTEMPRRKYVKLKYHTNIFCMILISDN